MLFPDSDGVKKLQYVKNLVNQLYTIDEDELRALIERAVYELKRK